MSGPGAAVANGHVVVNSGYGLYYHMPGNLLMVFTPGGK
jgi:polyvinyl alcohol dehydrogenase (cytochrome)